jgi:protein involved in polysaccharide export with SLBB domain
MRVIQRPLLLLMALVLGSVIGSSPQEARGQAATGVDPTELLRGLTPEQQEAILSRITGSSGGMGLPGSLGTPGGDTQTATGLRPGVDQERAQRLRPEGEEPEPLIPVLKSEDWVIIEADFHLPPRTVSPTTQALQSLYTGQGGVPTAQSAQALQALQALQSSAGGGATPPVGVAPAEQRASGSTSADPPGLTAEERKRLQALIDLIRSKNPYQLSRDGALSLPGFPPMALLGLTEDQATLRLKVEPAFRDIDIRLTRLPLKKSGAEALKPFGYDLFDRAPSTFAPVTNIPVPSDYVVGPGDELSVQLYGNQNRMFRLIVGRDGRISFPELGPISVGGQLFSEVKSNIESRVERQVIGVRANVSMGDTRAIRVFVLGEARRPGSYTVSGLATISSALYAAGGVKQIGSLRKIELKRQGQVVRHLDLYDLLIRGDTTDDAKLLQGDVIFVPSVGATVGVEGEVRRPAIYEIKNESTVEDVVQLAGGLTPQADTSSAMLTRIDEQEHRIVVQVDLSPQGAKAYGVRNGDLLRVMRLKPTLDSGVMVQGHVYTSGAFAYRPGLRLSNVIRSVDELQPNADLHYVLIRRELPPDRRVAVLSADLAAALNSPGSKADVELMPRDRITVFDSTSGRDHEIQSVLDELRLQSTLDHPTQVVHVDGRVKVPGEYPLEPGMTVADLIRAGGGLADAAYGGKAELTRYTVVNRETRRTQLIDIDLDAALHGDPTANVQLEPFDNLSVKEVSQWQAQESIALMGEVRFPGTYSIKHGETLKSVIARAGGLTDYAFPQGSVFTREELRVREQEQLDMLATHMQTDLTYLALQGVAASQSTAAGGGAAGALTVGQTLLAQLRSTKAVGRLVIDLPRLMREPVGSSDDVILRGGDRLIIPKFQQQVTVIGEVQNATSHLYNARLSRDDYISLSGGMTRRADRGRIYIVRANGSVVANEGSRWFQHGSSMTIKPGDTIVVPLNAERMPALPFWQAVTSILYNVAIAAAAVHAL